MGICDCQAEDRVSMRQFNHVPTTGDEVPPLANSRHHGEKTSQEPGNRRSGRKTHGMALAWEDANGSDPVAVEDNSQFIIDCALVKTAALDRSMSGPVDLIQRTVGRTQAETGEGAVRPLIGPGPALIKRRKSTD